MCNDYERHIEWEKYCQAVAAAKLGMPAEASAVQLPPADDVRVRDTAPVMIARGNVVDLVSMKWGFPPAREKGAPVFNFRSENRDFSDSRRCVIPASAFFEFTGTKTPKSKWRFTLNGEEVFGVAGLWREDPASFTMLTTAPGPDIEPYHGRQIVVLRPEDWGGWLYLDRKEKPLLQPLPGGSLTVELARAGRDAPPAHLPRAEHRGGKWLSGSFQGGTHGARRQL